MNASKEVNARQALSHALIFELEKLVDVLINAQLEALVTATPDPPRWMTTCEAAEHLRLSQAALRKRVQRGSMPAHRDGSRLLFDRVELDNAVKLVSFSTNGASAA